MIDFRRLLQDNLFGRRQRTRRLARTTAHALPVSRIQRLEDRAMLAGDVSAQLIGRDIYVSGDSADNSIEIVVDGGDLVIRGLDGTTINGVAGDFTLRAGSNRVRDDLKIDMGRGDDRVVIADGVIVTGDLRIQGGRGDDSIAVAEALIGDDLKIDGGSGFNTISVQETEVLENARIYGGNDGNLINISDSTIRDNLWIHGGSGVDDVVFDRSAVGDNLYLYTHGGDDNIAIRDTVLADDVFVHAGSGGDVVYIESTAVSDDLRIFGQSGDDSITILTSTVRDKLRAYEGSGTDAVEIDAATTARSTKARGFEASMVDATVIETRITDGTTGAFARAAAAAGAFDPTLTVTVNNATINEDDGTAAATVTITRSTGTVGDLIVTLTSSDGSRLEVPGDGMFTIPDGQSSVTVDLNAIDNSLFDGTVIVTLTAAATDFDSGTVDVTVNDDELPTLTVDISEDTVAEDTGSGSSLGSANTVSATVSRNGDTSEALTVTLTSSDTALITVPTEVVIAAGQASATFDITTVPNSDDTAEDNLTAMVVASATDFNSGQDSIIVTDNDVPFLTVQFDAGSVEEGGDSTVTVTRNTDTTNELVVDLASTDTSRLTVPATVTIPAGQSSVTFTATTVDNDNVDGDEAVSVTANSTGFLEGSESITVTEDDGLALTVTINTDTADEDGGSAATTAVISRNSTAATDLVVALSSSNTSRLTVPATVTIPSGASEVTIDLSTVDNDIVDGDATVVVSATASGATAGSDSVVVADDDVATITITPDATTVSEDAGTVNLTVERSTDTSAEETVNLSYAGGSKLTGPASVTFGIGESSKVVALTVVDDSSFAVADAVTTVTATATGHSTVFAAITVENDDIVTVTTDVSANTFEESVGTLVTKNATFNVSGTTAPNATVQFDTDGTIDGNDPTVTAAGDGTFSFDVTLTHDTTNRGANTIQVRSIIDGQDFTESLDVHLAMGSVVRFQTNKDFDNDGENDFYDVELLDTDAPITVANFKTYMNSSRYEDVIVHRSIGAFVIQGGGFTLGSGGGDLDAVPTDAAITNEFSSANSNVTGTLSMALNSTGVNSGTSQWFVNTVDNSANLDGARHTVFGRVIGDGMDVVNEINSLTTANLNGPLLGSSHGNPFDDLPLTDFPQYTAQLSGTMDAVHSITSVNGVNTRVASITGTGTQFTAELGVGSAVLIDSVEYSVLSITSDTTMVLRVDNQSVAPADVSGADGFVHVAAPQDDNFVVFSNIAEILDSM